MAKSYADNYNRIEFAVPDIHQSASRKEVAGMSSDTHIANERNFVRRASEVRMNTFTVNAE